MTSRALKSFWRCYEQLPAHSQKLADKNFALFKANPRHPSLGFSKKGAVYTVEIGRSYRALAREHNGHYYWFWIGTHEDYNRVSVLNCLGIWRSALSQAAGNLPAVTLLGYFFELRAEHIDVSTV